VTLATVRTETIELSLQDQYAQTEVFTLYSTAISFIIIFITLTSLSLRFNYLHIIAKYIMLVNTFFSKPGPDKRTIPVLIMTGITHTITDAVHTYKRNIIQTNSILIM
jgi:hypothetical protein